MTASSHLVSYQHLKRTVGEFMSSQGADFDAVALEVFSYQFYNNKSYQVYCLGRGLSPQSVNSWRAIPTVPTDVFRHVPLFCGDISEAAKVFRTSGTTSGKRGEHYLKSLELYHKSARLGIKAHLLPDSNHRRALFLAPPPVVAPDSSLSSMLGLIFREFVDRENSQWAWGDEGLDCDAAIAWLELAANQGEQPGVVLGTSFALIAIFDEMAARGVKVSLPPGTIVMPTGGTKGKTREVSAEALEVLMMSQLGVSADHIVMEYGMTELGSQFYDPRFSRSLEGVPSTGELMLRGPHWCRVTAHDPETLNEVEPGEAGLLRFTDLTNLDSVCSVQTSDMGRVLNVEGDGDSIVLIGRLPGARPRGCSLLIEELLG